MGVARHVVCDIDLRQFGGSALTGDRRVPTARSLDEIGHGIPITYVPARNTIFLPLHWPGPRRWEPATSSSA